MKIPYKYINNSLNSDVSIQEISEKLFQLGHEHEIEDDIFEMEFTPNRGDCLSLNGLLRDLSVFFELKDPFHEYKENIDKFSFNFENKHPAACPYISFLKIQISDEIKPYQNYLNDYFIDLNLNKNNFFTDISNYLLFETGQPTHCYDYKKIGKELTLENNHKPYIFKTVLGDEIKLIEEDLVFANGNEIINLAGVMGGESTACSSDTRDVIIECAYFNPENIIGKTVKYDIRSDAAYRFERGVDPLNQEATLRRFINIVKDHTNIKELELFTYKNDEYINTELNLDVDKVNKILGTQISKSEYISFLKKLKFDCYEDIIIVPSFRSDISNQNDLAEEIARLIGYDNINSSKLHIKKSKKVKKEFKEDKLKKVLIDYGFNEVINYPFVQENNHESIKVDNPLDKNKSFLRNSLESSLINNLLTNERRQKDSIKLFEISDLYSFKNNPQFERRIGIIASGRIGKNYIDFKKIISEDYLFNIARTIINNKKIKIKTISRESLDTKIKSKIFYLETNLSDISDDIFQINTESQYPNNFIIYRKISEYPYSIRDISFSLKDYSQLKPLEEKILSIEDKILKDIFIFDFYENTKKEELKIGFRFIFQSTKGTLTESEVEATLNDIIEIALSFNGVDIPGLEIK